MKPRTAAALMAIALLPLSACSSTATTTDKLSYQIDESLTELVIGAQAARVGGDGPVTVTEEHHYSDSKPITAHEVEGQSLRLTESGCGDDETRCYVAYTIRMPAAMSVDITAHAGTVELDGLAGDLRVTTEAGAVEGQRLTSDQVIIQTEAGAANLEFVEAPALLRTTTSLGAVNLRLPGTLAYALDVHTGVGASAVEVDRDPTSPHHITVHTEVGGVKIERMR